MKSANQVHHHPSTQLLSTGYARGFKGRYLSFGRLRQLLLAWSGKFRGEASTGHGVWGGTKEEGSYRSMAIMLLAYISSSLAFSQSLARTQLRQSTICFLLRASGTVSPPHRCPFSQFLIPYRPGTASHLLREQCCSHPYSARCAHRIHYCLYPRFLRYPYRSWSTYLLKRLEEPSSPPPRRHCLRRVRHLGYALCQYDQYPFKGQSRRCMVYPGESWEE